MKITVTLSSFKQAFRDARRGDHFSWEGLEVLFNFLEEMEEDSSPLGTEMELDVSALCNNFAEETPEVITANFGITSVLGADITKAEVIDWLQDRTTVVGKTTSGIIYRRKF